MSGRAKRLSPQWGAVLTGWLSHHAEHTQLLSVELLPKLTLDLQLFRRVWMGVLLRHDLQLHIVELVVAELERNEEREDVVGRCLKGTFPTQCRELSWCTFEDGGNDQVNGEGSQPCAGP